MDNFGVAKNENQGETSAMPNNFEGGIVDNFGAYGRESLSQHESLEGASNEAEKQGASERQEQAVNMAMPSMTAMPPIATETSVKNDAISEEMQAVLDTPVKRDAEHLPKAYLDNVQRVVNKDKKNPHQLVEDFDAMRWDLISKAFDRKRGDGR